MYIKCKTLDDLLNEVYTRILKSGRHVKPSKGWNYELTGVLLELTNPRARLSKSEKRGKLFSSIGEFLWYLSKGNKLEFIKYYIPVYENFSDDNKTIHGGYGPRLFNMHGRHNQIERIITLLATKSTSRKAVIQLFDASDLEKPYKDIPCTCTLQFAIRDERLEMFTSMRSNDAFWGLPHDIFAFTMLQEVIARSLNVEVGTYKHFAASLHIYDNQLPNAELYLKEGYQRSMAMPSLPLGNPWDSIEILLKAEKNIRINKMIDIDERSIESFWKDLILILQIHSCLRNGQTEKINALKKKFSSSLYNIYVDRRQVSVKNLDKIKNNSNS